VILIVVVLFVRRCICAVGTEGTVCCSAALQHFIFMKDCSKAKWLTVWGLSDFLSPWCSGWWKNWYSIVSQYFCLVILYQCNQWTLVMSVLCWYEKGGHLWRRSPFIFTTLTARGKNKIIHPLQAYNSSPYTNEVTQEYVSMLCNKFRLKMNS